MDILPEATRSKLRSTTILTSLTQVIIELVQNSLDAGANEIEIGIDAENWTCWVKDNGTGISRVSLEALSLGLEDRRYGACCLVQTLQHADSQTSATSKAYDTNSLDLVTTFGFRGEGVYNNIPPPCVHRSYVH
jgi:DNA mismatch repair protein MLH3